VPLIHSNFFKPNVNNLSNPFRINIGFLLNQAVGSSREFNFDYPDIEFPPDLVLREFKGKSRINRTPQGILVNSEVKACVELECVRCLEKYQQLLNTTFDELYAFSSRTATDSDLILPEDGYIDLQPLLREYLLIELPISPVCKEECLGLCIVCGVDKNLASCSHEEVAEGAANR
jgi:uncharacterized protein